MNNNLMGTLKKYTNGLPIIKILMLTTLITLGTAITYAEDLENLTNGYYSIYCESGDCVAGEIDTNYCVSNELCPLEGSGFEWSAIYINEIQHEGNEIINISIPEEIEREYTNNESGLNIEIIGYGYDQEKMQQLINTQYYTPTSEEMSYVIEKIADFLPLIAIALLIIRIRRVIKKVFKF